MRLFLTLLGVAIFCAFFVWQATAMRNDVREAHDRGVTWVSQP